MLQIETLSTKGNAPRQRIEYWNDLTSAILVDQVADPIDPISFSGRIRRTDLGDVRLAEVSSGASLVTHSKAHISQSREAVYLLRLPLTGNLTIWQDDRETRLTPGDFAVCDAARPYKLLMKQETVLLILRIPEDRFKRYIGIPEEITSLAMSGQAGASALASNFLRDFWRSADELQPKLAHRFGDVLMSLLESSYAVLAGARTARGNSPAQYRVRIARYIEDRLADPELTPRSIATAMGISSSYANRVFSDEETMGRYILRRRLEECARALGDPRHRARTVSTVAFSWGFNSLNHFSRVFCARYGVNPGEYRELNAPFG